MLCPECSGGQPGSGWSSGGSCSLLPGFAVVLALTQGPSAQQPQGVQCHGAGPEAGSGIACEGLDHGCLRWGTVELRALPPTANSTRFPAREAAEGVPGAGRGMKCTSAAHAAPGFSAAWGRPLGVLEGQPDLRPLVRRCCAALCWAPISVVPGDCSEQQVMKPERGGPALGGSAGGSSLHFRDLSLQDSSPQTCSFLPHFRVVIQDSAPVPCDSPLPWCC